MHNDEVSTGPCIAVCANDESSEATNKSGRRKEEEAEEASERTEQRRGEGRAASEKGERDDEGEERETSHRGRRRGSRLSFWPASSCLHGKKGEVATQHASAWRSWRCSTGAAALALPGAACVREHSGMKLHKRGMNPQICKVVVRHTTPPIGARQPNTWESRAAQLYRTLAEGRKPLSEATPFSWRRAQLAWADAGHHSAALAGTSTEPVRPKRQDPRGLADAVEHRSLDAGYRIRSPRGLRPCCWAAGTAVVAVIAQVQVPTFLKIAYQTQRLWRPSAGGSHKGSDCRNLF